MGKARFRPVGGSGTQPGLASRFLQFPANVHSNGVTSCAGSDPLPLERAVLLKVGNVKSSMSGLLTTEGDKSQVQFGRTFYFQGKMQVIDVMSFNYGRR